MSVVAPRDLDRVDLGDLDLWSDGPPHELFTRLRRDAPAHWSPLADHPDEGGFWSLTRAADVRRVSLDWETFSSHVGGVLVLDDFGIPLEAQQQQMISMDPPRHDRIKALFQRGFTPKRIAEHEERIRGIVNRVLDRVAQRGECDLVLDVAGPVVSRVIGSFIGTPEEDDRRHMEETNMVLGFGDEDLRPTEQAVVEMMSRNWDETMELIAERRENPGMDDLMDVLVHSEVDGEKLSEAEIFMGLGLLGAAGNDSTRAVFTSGMLALFEAPDQLRALLADPTLIDGAVEELLRLHPAFAHFRRTATRDLELHGETIRAGDKVLLWYVAANRDEEVYTDPQRLDVTRVPDHQAFGAGGRHFCLGAALARLEIRMLLTETLRRFADIELAGEPTRARSMFLNQLKTLPVRFTPEPG
ncbi:MAG: cytochrome P450 [Solirubrobacterales bacterium]|nr:cytochrome P450 [Solirubrobacterales bacterium]